MLRLSCFVPRLDKIRLISVHSRFPMSSSIMCCSRDSSIHQMKVHTQTVVYGEDKKEQYFRLHYVDGEVELPVVVIIHGGFWMQYFGLDNALIDTVAPFFVEQGFVAVEIEYRRGNRIIDKGKGGWPRTNEDISNALIKLHSLYAERQTEAKMNLSKVMILGHSAGGTLALWACEYSDALTRENPNAQAPLFKPLPFTPHMCVAIAPIGDLAAGHKQGLSSDGNAVLHYMGAEPLPLMENNQVNPECPYGLASPSNLLPLKCKSLIISGSGDYIVPGNLIDRFSDDCLRAAANSSSPVPTPEVLKIQGADHFMLVNSSSHYWQEIWQKIMQIFNS